MKNYYLAGGHIYADGKTEICFAETPTGDGRLLWVEQKGKRIDTPSEAEWCEFIAMREED